MSSQPTIGDQELQILQWVQNRSQATVRDVAEGIGAELGLARTTVLTVLERLRKKGYLTRSKVDGSFTYIPTDQSVTVSQGLMTQFFNKTLRGSLTAFVAHLVESEKLDNEEIEQLRGLLNDAESKQEKKQ